MINQRSLDVVAKSSFGAHFAKPIYDTYGFAQIPATIESLLGLGNNGLAEDAAPRGPYDIVLLFLIDGFGWNFFEAYQDHPVLQKIAEKGTVSKLTSQFPSTTAAHVTCINTGLEVGQSGVYEWFYFEPKVDAVIAPLLFSYAGDHVSGTLAKKGFKANDLFPFTTLYESLQKHEMPSYVFQHDNTAQAPYSQVIFRGAEITSYPHLEVGLKRLMRKLRETKRGYFYFYFGDIDSTAHRHGFGSLEAAKVCRKALDELDGFLAQLPDKKIAVMLTADHGMIDIDPKTTFYLNKKISRLEAMLQKNKTGKPIVPAGSCRDFFLHVEERVLSEAESLLKEQLASIAEVHRVETLIKAGFFGFAPPSPAFLSHVGNLVVLPLRNNSVWWYEKHRFEQRFHAMHGGLTREELEIPFLFFAN